MPAAQLPFTAAYPELGTAPIDVQPLISPQLFEQEREALFKRVWLKVGREEEIPAPGDYKVKRIDVARTSVLIVRGRDGKLRAFHNVCTHRGNKVVDEAGNETFGHARTHMLTCRFHAWTYNTDGSLRGVQKPDKFADLDKGCLGLKPVHCDSWEGFIFINLDREPRQSLREYLGGMADHFAGFPYHEATTRYRYSSILKCNWKVALYAFSEGYHVPTIHAGTLPSLAVLEHVDFKLYGPHSTSGLYIPGLGELEPTPATGILGGLLRTSKQHGPCLDKLPDTINPQRRQDFQFEFPVFFPNFLLHLGAGNGYPGMMFFHHQFWPISVDQTLWEGTNYFCPPTNAAEQVAIAHINALHRNAWLEDTSTMEATHDALCSGVLTQMPLMDEEIMIRNTHHHWHRYMDGA